MKRLPTFEQSCASIPENVLIWHIDNDLKPEQVFKCCGKMIKWNCFSCDHVYEQTPAKKNGYGRGCPYCCNPPKLLCEKDCETCFSKSCASNPKMIELWNENNELKPEQVFKSSGTKINWNCNVCNHIYEQSPHKKTALRDCPYCANKILCEKDCDICFNKSCASIPNNVLIWHTDNKLKPEQVFKNSNYKIKWNCLNCNHVYEQSVSHKNGRDRNCPYCCNPPKKLCEKDCETCFYKSCASIPDNVLIWNSDNKLHPRQVFLYSNAKYKWNCLKCTHVYYQTAIDKNGIQQSGCPYCCNPPQKICESECEKCFNKTCASIPSNVLIWHSDNELKPEQVFINSNNKIKWNCLICNNFYEQSPANKNGGKNACLLYTSDAADE